MLSNLETAISSAILCTCENLWISHDLSPHAPKAASYNPPGTGWSRVSNVVGFWTFFTERALMSSEERKPKSTLPMQEAIGCEIFMLVYVFHVICLGIQCLPSTSCQAPKCQKFGNVRIKVSPSHRLAEFTERPERQHQHKHSHP